MASFMLARQSACEACQILFYMQAVDPAKAIVPETNAAQFYISDDSASTCDETLTASTPRLGLTLGGVILGNTSRQGRLPMPSMVDSTQQPKSYYLVCSSVAAATLRMELAEQ